MKEETVHKLLHCYVNLRILKRIDIDSQERHSHLEGFLLEALEASEDNGNAGKSTGDDDNVDNSDEDDWTEGLAPPIFS